MKLTYIHKGQPRGIAHAVRLSKDFVKDDSFVVYLGDNLLKKGIGEHVERFRNSTAAAHIALCHVKNPSLFGVAGLDTTGKVIRLVEKPTAPRSDLALVGVYMFRSHVFDAINTIKPSWRGELEITDAIQKLMDLGLEVSTHIISGWWKDTGKPENILEANHSVLSDLNPANRGTLEADVTAVRKTQIGQGTIVKSKSTLMGPVIIGVRCGIGPGTYVGPYTFIGTIWSLKAAR